MKYARWLRRARLPGVAALAVAAITLGSYGAQASTFTGSGLTFSTQSVAASVGGGTVTIGVGAPGVPVVYVSNTCVTTGARTVNFTLTLPAGVTFAAPNPAATGTGTFSAVTLTLGGIGSSFATYNVTATCAAAGDTGTLTFGAFGLTGATALATPNTVNFQATASLSDPTALGMQDLGKKAQLASSASSVLFLTVASVVAPLAIDITNPSLGAQFLQGGVDSIIGDQGAVQFVISSLQNAADTAVFVPQTTANVILTGNWGNLGTSTATAPFLLAGAAAQVAACPATKPATAVAGTIAGNTLTFPNVTLPTPAQGFLSYEVCLQSAAVSGKTIIASNVLTTVTTDAVGAGVFPGFFATALDAYTYNGSVQQLLYTGTFTGGFQSFARIVNNTGLVAKPIVLVQPDVGTSGFVNGFISVPANGNVLQDVPALVKASGAVPDGTGRVSLLFLTPGTPCVNNAAGVSCSVSVSGIMVSANGTFVLNGSGSAP